MGLQTQLETLDTMVIQYWCQETEVLTSPFPISPKPSEYQPRCHCSQGCFSVDWKGSAEERVTLETGSALCEVDNVN